MAVHARRLVVLVGGPRLSVARRVWLPGDRTGATLAPLVLYSVGHPSIRPTNHRLNRLYAPKPIHEFGRAFAAYGGVFIAMSVAWAALLDGFKPDLGDYVGGGLCVVGAAVVVYWPR